MTPVDVKLSTYINTSKEIIDEDPKFKTGDIVRISEHKNIFCGKVFVIKKVKNTVLWTYVISDLKREEILGKRIAKKQIKRSLELKK